MDYMCGRYASPPEERIVQVFGVRIVRACSPPSRNVAPTQTVSIVTEGPQDDGTIVRELQTARWGLVPSWVKAIDKRSPLINARAETLTEKPSFRAAATRRRAIVPATGYYEWAANTEGRKTPYFLHPDGDDILGFAGLYEWWHQPDESWLCSTALVTRAASDALGHIHDRMPVVVPPDMLDDWLSPALTARADVEALLESMPDPVLTPTQQAPG